MQPIIHHVPPAPPDRPAWKGWLDHVGSVTWFRFHISAFAIGAVVLLSANLLADSGSVWAQTGIIAWGILILAHAIALIIARLLAELLRDDSPRPIRAVPPTATTVMPGQPAGPPAPRDPSVLAAWLKEGDAPASPPPPAGAPVSWTVATRDALTRNTPTEDPPA